MVLYTCDKCGHATPRADRMWAHLTKVNPCTKQEILVNIRTMQNYSSMPSYSSYQTESITATDVANMSDFDGLSITGSEAAYMTNNAF